MTETFQVIALTAMTLSGFAIVLSGLAVILVLAERKRAEPPDEVQTQAIGFEAHEIPDEDDEEFEEVRAQIQESMGFKVPRPKPPNGLTDFQSGKYFEDE